MKTALFSLSCFVLGFGALACGEAPGEAADGSGGMPTTGGVGSETGGATGSGGAATGGTAGGTGGTALSGEGAIVSVFYTSDEFVSLPSPGSFVLAVESVGMFGSVSVGSEAFGACTVFSGEPEAPFGWVLKPLGAGLVTSTSPELSGTSSMDSDVMSPELVPFDGFFLGGESLTVTATGGPEVGAFEADMAMPLAVIVQTPAVDAESREIVASRASDLTLTWERGAAEVVVAIEGGRSPTLSGLYDRWLSCAFDSTAGTGTIPAAALAAVGASTVKIRTERRTSIVVDGKTVSLRAIIGARHVGLEGSLAGLRIE